MKKTDIAMIILIASVSVLIAYFVTNSIMGSAINDSVKVKTISPITSKVDDIDTTVFNKDAINPTVEVIIGDNSKQTSSQ